MKQARPQDLSEFVMIKSSPDDHPVTINSILSSKLNTQKTIDSHTLFDGKNEIAIKHRGAIYRLKITRQGKLILNK